MSITSPTPLHYDSTRALQIVADPVKHELTKHIGVDAPSHGVLFVTGLSPFKIGRAHV